MPLSSHHKREQIFNCGPRSLWFAAVKLMKLLEVEFRVENIYQRVSLAWFSFFSYEDNVYIRFHCSSYIDASLELPINSLLV